VTWPGGGIAGSYPCVCPIKEDILAQFHFVEDYERLVAHLVSTLPLDEAMSQAVGGGFAVGAIERDILQYAGLRNGMSLLDLGCGSGRLAKALGSSMKIGYTGLDIVQPLLDYAAKASPPNYRFVLNRALSIPCDTSSIDMACAFSVFTHLLHAETYIYLEDIRRVLKPGGHLVFSFLAFGDPNHWTVFANTVAAQRTMSVPHLNMFIERNAIELWCSKLDLTLVKFIDGTEAHWRTGPLGQAVAIVEKPSA
jgi:SAM-dependent methyltransferase